MLGSDTNTRTNSLNYLGLNRTTAHWNLSPDELEEIAIQKDMAIRTSSGAIAVDTGAFKGRAPKDRFIVKDDITRDAVWWGNINYPFDPEKFDKLYDKVIDYLNHKEIYVRDAIACADKRYRINIRAITEMPWSNQFIYNMFLHPLKEELSTFIPEWHIVAAPNFKAISEEDGTRQHNFAILNFTRKIALIGGTAYTGEMKKGIFSALNFILPHQKNVLSMHCSANVGQNNDTALFFGLSGTGKTTLSADPNRKLIGDDEHGWSDDSIFNFEGGCYAKCINLSEENEPDIYRAIKKGAILENIEFYPDTNEVDYSNASKTENTRASYPVYHIDNITEPSIGPEPENIFFLTCDAFGVLPPISKLTPEQAAFQFISGYTAKVAGTEEGIVEPVTVFSACFGAPFMLLHPTVYGDMLSEKIQKSGANVWLVNTGWSGGGYGVGERMSLKITRALITAALEGHLDNISYKIHDIFGLRMPNECPGVPSKVLHPKNTWDDKEDYDRKANLLAKKFIDNFEKFKDGASKAVLAARPVLKE